MYRVFFMFAISALPVIYGVKVSVQGALTMGKEVVDAISFYLDQNQTRRFHDTRRSNLPTQGHDTISQAVQATVICADLPICDHKLNQFIEEYVILQSTTVLDIIHKVSQKTSDSEFQVLSYELFEDQIKLSFKTMRMFMKEANSKMVEYNKGRVWTEVIKKISAKIQQETITFVIDNLKGDPKNLTAEKKSLTLSIVLATIKIESDREVMLCIDFRLCKRKYDSSKALHNLLSQLHDLPDQKVREFVKIFYDSLSHTHFYSILSQVTSTELQLVLNDMAYSMEVPTKDILYTVQRTLEKRMKNLENYEPLSNNTDVQLVNMIMSDMDHFYERFHEPFESFFSEFSTWVSTGNERLRTAVKQVMKDIKAVMSDEPELLVLKFMNQIRVFLEVTVDPDE